MKQVEIKETLEYFDCTCKSAREILEQETIDCGDLKELNLLFGGSRNGCFGVESITLADGVSRFHYINTGDTYSTTVGYVEEYCTNLPRVHPPTLTTWGDAYEQFKADYEEATGTIHCGYCGAFTEKADNWCDTVCEYCQHSVCG